MTQLQTAPVALAPGLISDDAATALEQVMIAGDLSRLTPAQKVAHYSNLCTALGLNPMSKPFAYLSLNNKLVLYALKDATDQLRKIHGISLTIVARQREDEVFYVTAQAIDKSGRTDEAIGAVPISGTDRMGQSMALKGEALANAYMKAETKAKRRVTLSICGLGMLDETEIRSIPDAEVIQMSREEEAILRGDSIPVQVEIVDPPKAEEPKPQPPKQAGPDAEHIWNTCARVVLDKGEFAGKSMTDAYGSNPEYIENLAAGEGWKMPFDGKQIDLTKVAKALLGAAHALIHQA